MPSETLAFFSSDNQELYKADAYRTAALPEKYVIQFRYRRKYIERQILTNARDAKGKSGIIFFVAGNISGQIEDTSKISLRRVTVREVDIDEHIDSVHFYLELGAFVDATPHKETQESKLPPNTFVSTMQVNEGPNSSWASRIDAIKPHFPDVMFLAIDGIYKGKKLIAPHYDENLKASVYCLEESSSYQCPVTMLDDGVRKSGLKATNSSPDTAEFICSPEHRLAAKRDTKRFEVQTHTISQKVVTAFTRLCDKHGEDSDAWSTELKWVVKRSRLRSIKFGALVAIGASGIALSRIATSDLADVDFDKGNYIIGGVSVLLICVASSCLFGLFNKK